MIQIRSTWCALADCNPLKFITIPSAKALDFQRPLGRVCRGGSGGSHLDLRVTEPEVG